MRRVRDEFAPRAVELRHADAHPLEGSRELAQLVVAAVHDGLVEATACNSLCRPLQSADAARMEPGRNEPEPQRDEERDRRCSEQAPLDEVHRRERVRQGGNEQDDGAGRGQRDGDLGVALAAARHEPTLRLPGSSGEIGRQVALDIPRARAAGVRKRRQGGRIRGQHVVDDDPRVDEKRVLLGPTLPEDPVAREAGDRGNRVALELDELGLNQPVLERRDDNGVGGTERAGNDHEQREREPRTNPARPDHRSRKR